MLREHKGKDIFAPVRRLWTGIRRPHATVLQEALSQKIGVLQNQQKTLLTPLPIDATLDTVDRREKVNPQKELVTQFIEGAQTTDLLGALSVVRSRLIDPSAKGGHIDLRSETPNDNPHSHSTVRGTRDYAGETAVSFTNNGYLVNAEVLLVSLFAGVNFVDMHSTEGHGLSAYVITLNVNDEVSGIWIPLSEVTPLAQVCLNAMSEERQRILLRAMKGYSQNDSIMSGLLANNKILDINTLKSTT